MNDTTMQAAPISQDDINAAVWAACDTFRGTVAPDVYKDYVLTVLFLKYVSDVWQDHYDTYSRNYEAGKNQNLLREADIQRILDTAAARQNVDKYAYLAAPGEIAGNDFNLNIPRYVDTFEEEAEIDLMAVRREREVLKAELAALETQMEVYLKELGYE